MAQGFADDASRDAFLADTRLAILMTNRKQGTPIGVPVWFDWDGESVWMFAAKGSPKLTRIENDPRVSVLVTNHVGEPEAWVGFDGIAEITGDDPGPLIGRLGERYWDMTDPERRAMIDSWVQASDAMVLLRIRPDRIRSGA